MFKFLLGIWTSICFPLFHQMTFIWWWLIRLSTITIYFCFRFFYICLYIWSSGAQSFCLIIAVIVVVSMKVRVQYIATLGSVPPICVSSVSYTTPIYKPWSSCLSVLCESCTIWWCLSHVLFLMTILLLQKERLLSDLAAEKRRAIIGSQSSLMVCMLPVDVHDRCPANDTLLQYSVSRLSSTRNDPIHIVYPQIVIYIPSSWINESLKYYMYERFHLNVTITMYADRIELCKLSNVQLI